LVFEAAAALRRRGEDEAAGLDGQCGLRTRTTSSAGTLAAERGIMARDALKAGKRTGLSVCLDAGAGCGFGRRFMDAEFLAGWIALQSLTRPSWRLSIRQAGKGRHLPISVGARALLARPHRGGDGRPVDACGVPHCAQHSATFYGQLAAAKLPPTRSCIHAVASELARRARRFRRG